MYKPLMWLFRVFGMNPQDNYLDKYCTTLSIGLGCAVFLPVLSTLPNMLVSIFGFLIFIYTLCSIVSFVGCVGMNLMYRQYPTILKRLMQVKDQLTTIDAEFSSRLMVDKVVFYSFISWYCVICIMNLLKMVSLLKWIRNVSSFISNLAIMQHVVVVSSLNQMFFFLNNYLRQVTKTSDNILASTVSSHLKDIFHIHTALHDIISEINTHYFFTNLFSFISNMSAVVFSMYGYLQYIDGNEIFDLDFIVITLISQAVVFFIQAIVCHACAKQANITVFLAHRVLRADSPLSHWESVGDFSHLALDNKVAFSVGSLFNLDRPLVTKVVLACLSYLIVAVQLQSVQIFETSFNDKNNNTNLMTGPK